MIALAAGYRYGAGMVARRLLAWSVWLAACSNPGTLPAGDAGAELDGGAGKGDAALPPDAADLGDAGGAADEPAGGDVLFDAADPGNAELTDLADASPDELLADGAVEVADAATAADAPEVVLTDAVADPGPSDAASTDAGPAWLGQCPPWAPTAYGKSAELYGYPVPGKQCAKPGWPSAATASAPQFTDITAKIGLDKLGVVDSCLLWEDLTGDGVPDLFVVEQPAGPAGKRFGRLYEINGTDKWVVTSVALPASMLVIDCARMDWSASGKPDIVLTGTSGVRALQYKAGTFFDQTSGAVPSAAKGVLSWTIAVADIDRDGDQDAYIGRTGQMNLQPGNYACNAVDPPYAQCCYGAVKMDAQCLAKVKATPVQTYTCCPPYELGATNLILRNDTGMLNDASVGSGAEDPWASLAVAARDIDRDGWVDLFSGNDFGPLGWYRNQGNGSFAYASTALGLRPYGHTMGVSIGDFNGDGLDDLTTADVGPTSVYLGKTGGGWQADGGAWQTWPATQNGIGWVQLAADFDNDGWLDLLSGQSMQAKPGQLLDAMQTANPLPLTQAGGHVLFRNAGGVFQASALPWPVFDQPAIAPVAAAATDFDGDGDLDLAFTAAPGVLRVLRNDAAPKHWLEIEMAPTDSATGGVGAIVQAWAQGHVQERTVQWTAGSLAHGTYTQHFGLGAVATLDHVVVWWPSGKVQTLDNVAADQVLLLDEAAAQAKTAPPVADAGPTDSADAETADAPPEVALGGPGNSGITPIALQNQAQAPFVEITGSLGLELAAAITRKDCIIGADFDGDNRDDLVAIEQEAVGPGKTTYRFRSWLNKLGGPKVVLSTIDGTLYVPALGCMAGDLNSDGKPDIVFGTVGSGMAVYQNDGEGTFTDKTANFLPDGDYDGWGGALADFDHDGDIELLIGAGNTGASCEGISCGYVPGDFWCKYAKVSPPEPSQQDHYYKRPNAYAKFADLTAAMKLPPGGEATEMAAIDVDRDGWVDALVGNDFGDHFLLYNQQGKFVRYDKEIGFAGYAHHMGWGFGDFNGDGAGDLFVADAGPSLLYIAVTPTAGMPVNYQNQALQYGVAAATHDVVAWNPLVFDADHDGDEDVWLPTSAIAPDGDVAKVGTCKLPVKPAVQRDLLLRNNGGQFEALTAPIPKNQQEAFAATPAVALDIDDDGDLDIAEVRRGGSLHVYRNDFAKPNTGVLVRLLTKVKNSAAIGAWMSAKIGAKVLFRHQLGNTGYGGSGLWRAHFGLGDATQIDELVVHWPNGATSVHKNVAAGSKLILGEP